MTAHYPRVGLVRVADQLLLESMVQILANKDHVGLLFAGGIIPVQMRDSWERHNYTEYCCISPHFPIVPAGQQIPVYDLSLTMEEGRLAEIHIAGADPPHIAIARIKIKAWDIEVDSYAPDQILATPHNTQRLADSLGISVDALRSSQTAAGADPAPADPDPPGGADAADEPG